MPSLRSTNDLLYAAQTYGMLRREWVDYISNASGASATSGYVTLGRCSRAFTIPGIGSGISGCYLTSCIVLGASGRVLVGLEYVLGTLTVTGNVFAGGASMPVKQGVQTVATMVAVCVETASMTATNPVLTITYTNQDGTPGRTATLTLPTNSGLHSCFLVGPHLMAGDTGIRAITNLSISTGSGTAVLRVRGILPVAQTNGSALTLPTVGSPLEILTPAWLLEPGDALGVYLLFFAGGVGLFVHIAAVAER